MSASLQCWAWAVRGPAPLDKFVLVALADAADMEGAFPEATLSTVAGRTGLNLEQVRDAVARLARRGLLMPYRNPKHPVPADWRLAVPA